MFGHGKTSFNLKGIRLKHGVFHGPPPTHTWRYIFIILDTPTDTNHIKHHVSLG